MSLTEALTEFRDREGSAEILSANWYIVAASALAAASAGSSIPELYSLATSGADIETEKIIQRRIKDAILKTSCLYGVPRSLQALLPLFATLPDDHIDHFGPRYDSLGSNDALKMREKKGRRYFDTLWGEEAAQFHRDRNYKYQPDLYLLNLKMIYEWHFSEDAILSNIETQMCNAAALICSLCPTQATWHTRGILRHGGSLEQAKFAQDIGLRIAKLYDCKTGDIVPADKIDVTEKSPH